MRSDVACAFRTDDLDARLLSTPFGELTNWHVIAGAPSCGKTTLIDALAAHGFATVPEPARAYMEGEIARGRTIEDIHRDGATLQRTLVGLQSAVEEGLPPRELRFLDGAVPVSLAWYRAFGLDPNEILPMCFRHRYASVVLLDPLPLDVDDIRFDDTALVSFIDRWIARDCNALGYDVVRVPALAPESRLSYVLECLALGRPA